MSKLGHKVNAADIESGVPPVVLQAQVTGYIPISKPQDLRDYEERARLLYGITIDLSKGGLHACDTCSGGCADDCGMLA
jgi:hypothetical protein